MSSLAGRGRFLVHELGAGEEDGGCVRACQGLYVVGVDDREVVERAGVVPEGDRHGAHGRELLDVRAQQEIVAAGERAHPVEVLEAESDRLDEDVERGGVLRGLRDHRLDLVHPLSAV